MKRILSIMLVLVMIIGMLPMTLLTASAANEEIVFQLGADGSASHKDGSAAKTEYSETVDGYTLSITGGNKMYPSSIDAKGNGCIKLGTSSAVGGFTFTVPDGVDSVVIAIAKYKTNTTKVSVNGTTYTLTNTSNNGAYDEIDVDTTTTKTVTVTTVSGGVRAMVNSITFICSNGSDTETTTPACEHNYTSVVTDPTCTESGYTTFTCSLCEDSHVSDWVDALGHEYGDWVVDPAATCTEAGQQTKTCATCGDVQTEVIAATGHSYEGDSCSVCGAETPNAIATLITSADQLVSGNYILMVSSGYAMGVYDNGWITAVKPVLADGEIVDAAGGIWTLTVDGTSVVIKDANGVFIAPKTGNNNGIIEGEYSWAWSVNEDGTFVFAGTGDDTTKLASNTTSENKFRAYKNTTVEGNTTGYLANFAVYKMIEGGEIDPELPIDPSACEHANTTFETVDPSCTEDGYEKTICADCGEVLDTEVMGATGHTYVDGTCSGCGAADPNAGTEENTNIVFELGENGTATHADGSSATTYSETVNGYTLTLTASDKMYTSARDAMGNSCVKLGTGSVVGGFSFAVPDDVTAVIIRVAKYKANNSKVNVNGTEYTLTKNSNDGAYDEITVDTTTNKTVSVVTVSGASRAMVNSITFIRDTNSEADHTCVWDEGTVTKTADCLEEGVMTYSCTVDGCDKIKTEAIAKTGHTMTNGTCSVCGAEYYTLSTTLNNNDSVVIYYSASKVAMTATASGTKLSGASVVIDESGLLTNDDLAIMKVQYVEGSTTDFYLICNGKYLTSGATGNSLTFAEEVSDYAEWYIEVVEGGENTVYIHNRNAVYNGSSQSMEFYSGFTTFGTKTTDIYKFQLYTKGENAIACEHSWSDWEIVNDASCTTAGEQKSVCANCGAEKTETIAATGHTYVFGDTEVTCTAGDVSVVKSDIGNVPKSADSNVYYVEGIVTFVDGGTVYIQDATGGITLRLASSVSAPKIGDQVEGIGTCSSYNGLIQLQDAYFETVSSDNTVEAQEVTLAEVKADTTMSYQAKKVSMKGLTITVVGTYSANYKNVDYTVTDGTNTFLLYRTPAATEADVLAVGDVINVVGVVGYYNDYQLRVVDGSDITIAPSIELTHISLDPVNDALGFKATIKGDLPADAQVGITMSVEGGLEKTYLVNVSELKTAGVVSLRLKGIMACNGGEMKITGTPVIVIGEETTTGTSVETSMKDTIEYINNNFASFEAYKAVIVEYVSNNYDAMKSWNIANIYTPATEE